MKPKPFEELLAGATPGEWNSYYLDSASVNPGRCAFIHGPKMATMDKMTGFKAEDAEYIARCSPAVMREVWEALKCANENIIEKDNAPFICALFTETEARLLRRALAAINGEKAENKED